MVRCILIEFTTFYQCKTTKSTSTGAALLIYCGNIVLNQVCGYQCQSAGNYGFSYIRLSYSSSSATINTVIETSVSNCTASSSYTMQNYYGFINISTVNLSFNEVTNSYSAFYCYPSQNKHCK